MLLALMTLLLTCGLCCETKPSQWFAPPLSRCLCLTCERLQPEWITDIAEYPPFFASMTPDIDWSLKTCPRCSATLFAEELADRDFTPCCAAGVAAIRVECLGGAY